MTSEADHDGDLPPTDGRAHLIDNLERAQERRRLASELLDIVTHHLANVALRTMGELDLADPASLRIILDDVHSAASSALVELRLLAHVLADQPGSELRLGTVAELSHDLTPTAAAAACGRRLRQAGLLAHYAVPEAADHLARSVQGTITRTLEATAEAALRHARGRSRCSVTVHVEPTRVLVRSATIPPPKGVSSDHLEPELRGLRERVDLTHGQFAGGVSASTPGRPQWTLTVILPLD